MNFSQSIAKMLQIKFIFFAVVASMIVGSTVAIIRGKDATRGQFPYLAYLEVYKLPKPVNSTPIFSAKLKSFIDSNIISTTAKDLY